VLGPGRSRLHEAVYMYDPNGLQVELTCRTSKFDSTMEEESRTVRDKLTECAERTRQIKNEKFGAEAVAMRSRQKKWR
jgi:hypothetical protein